MSGGEGGEGGRRGQSGRGGGQGRSADVLTRRWSARVFSTQAWGGEGVGNDSRGWAESPLSLSLSTQLVVVDILYDLHHR